MGWNAKFATGTTINATFVPILEDLRLAIIERIEALGRSIPAELNTAVTPGILTVDWFSAFHTEMTILIPSYVNHTINGGDFEGELIIPDWTEATMLTAIGDASRYSAPALKQLTDKWIIQQHDILNLLLWHQDTLPLSNWTSRNAHSFVTWSLAEADYAITPLGSPGGSNLWEYVGDDIGASRYVKSMFFKQVSSYAFASIGINADIYSKIVQGGGNTFETFFGFTENTFTKLESIITSGSYSYQPDTTMADASFPDPTGQRRHTDAEAPIAVIKEVFTYI